MITTPIGKFPLTKKNILIVSGVWLLFFIGCWCFVAGGILLVNILFDLGMTGNQCWGWALLYVIHRWIAATKLKMKDQE